MIILGQEHLNLTTQNPKMIFSLMHETFKYMLKNDIKLYWFGLQSNVLLQ